MSLLVISRDFAFVHSLTNLEDCARLSFMILIIIVLPLVVAIHDGIKPIQTKSSLKTKMRTIMKIHVGNMGSPL